MRQAFADELQVNGAAFSKRRGLGVLDMAKSNWFCKRLRNFRPGTATNISALKCRFGLHAGLVNEAFSAISGAMSFRTTCWFWRESYWLTGC